MVSSFIVIYKCLNEDLTSSWDFGIYKQMRHPLYPNFVFASSKGSGQSTNLHRFDWAFMACYCYKYQGKIVWFIWFFLRYLL